MPDHPHAWPGWCPKGQGPPIFLTLLDEHSASGQGRGKPKPSLMNRPRARISRCLMGLQWTPEGLKNRPTEKRTDKNENWCVFIAVSSVGPCHRWPRQQICRGKSQLQHLPEGPVSASINALHHLLPDTSQHAHSTSSSCFKVSQRKLTLAPKRSFHYFYMNSICAFLKARHVSRLHLSSGSKHSTGKPPCDHSHTALPTEYTLKWRQI